MSSTKKNFAYQIAYQILVSILPFITSPYLARVIGAEGVGVYSYTRSVVVWFLVFADLGIVNYGNRAVARVRDDKENLSRTFSSLYALHVVLVLLDMAAYLIYLRFFVTENRVIAWIQIFYMIGDLFDINWFFFGLEKFRLTVVRNMIVKVATVFSVFIFVKSADDLWIYVFILAFGQCLSSSCVWMFVPRYTKFSRFTVKDMLAHLKPLAVLGFSSIAVTIYSYMDKIMIGSMSSAAELGYYENAWKMIEFPVAFITALGTVLLPKASNLVAKGVNIDGYIEKSMRISMFFASAVGFGLAAIADDFAVMFWGEDFARSGTLIFIMSVLVFIMSWNGVVRSVYLIPEGHDKVYMWAVISAAAVNLIINGLLIPRYGSGGAAVGTVFAYLAVFIVQNIYAKRELNLGRYVKTSIPYFVVGFIMFAAVRFAGSLTGATVAGVCIQVAAGAAVYMGLAEGYAFAFKDQLIMDSTKEIVSHLKKRPAKK